MTPSTDPCAALPAVFVPIAARAAVEGIPVLATARVLGFPAELIYETLKQQLELGVIIELPRADWPATARRSDRVPDTRPPLSSDDIQFAVHKLFRLTQLEAGFFMLLLKHERADKAKLHHVVEQQRLARAYQPDTMEVTDPKIVDVIICKLRKKLKTIDEKVTITTIWGGGYYIDPAVKAHVMARVCPHATIAPDAGEPHDDAAAERAPVDAGAAPQEPSLAGDSPRAVQAAGA